jgi:hypothetical protein
MVLYGFLMDIVVVKILNLEHVEIGFGLWYRQEVRTQDVYGSILVYSFHQYILIAARLSYWSTSKRKWNSACKSSDLQVCRNAIWRVAVLERDSPHGMIEYFSVSVLFSINLTACTGFQDRRVRKVRWDWKRRGDCMVRSFGVSLCQILTRQQREENDRVCNSSTSPRLSP